MARSSKAYSPVGNATGIVSTAEECADVRSWTDIVTVLNDVRFRG
jgi:hypothetical protein